MSEKLKKGGTVARFDKKNLDFMRVCGQRATCQALFYLYVRKKLLYFLILYKD